MEGTKAQPVVQFLKKLSGVAKDCAYIRKDAKNEFHKYNYVSAANVLEKISESLQAHGLVSWTESFIHEIREKTNQRGTIELIAIAGVNLTISDIETGYSITVRAHGAGQDPGDKAVMKAQTAALKYAWMMCLLIATGDDPEADREVDENSGAEPQPTKFRKGSRPRIVEQSTEQPKALPWEKPIEVPPITDEYGRCGKCSKPNILYTAKNQVTYVQCPEGLEQYRLTGDRTHLQAHHSKPYNHPQPTSPSSTSKTSTTTS